jgi:hypothetical protein
MSAGLDLKHTAQPSMLKGFRTQYVGNVLVNRCVVCNCKIWRTADRFLWSHSTPSRTARITSVK